MATTATTNQTSTNPLSGIANAFTQQQGDLMGRQSTLSEWVGPYVTDMLGKAKALTEQPYQVYQGPLTAGTSALQEKALQGIGGLTMPQGLGAAQTVASDVASAAKGLGFTPSQFGNQFAAPGAYQAGTFQGGIFGGQQAQQYMNPFIQSALTPAMDELRRQTEISRVQQAGRLAQAGAFGGSRQAIMESELNRNLMDAQRRAIGEGYMTAYDKAAAQYNADMARAMEAQRMGEQSRQFGASQGMTAAQLGAQYGTEAQRMAEQSRQFGAQYGLQGLAQRLDAARALGALGSAYGAEERANLAAMLGAGATQRGIESEGIAADLAEFERQRDYPFKMIQFEQSLLQGLPVASVAAQYQQPSTLTNVVNTAGGLMDLYNRFFKSGATAPAPSPANPNAPKP